MSRLGVMGGTFDPIHFGHLLAAEEARAGFNLDRVVFIPSGHPPHKGGKHVTASIHRYAMTAMAIAGNPHFCISTIEIDRPGPSYTVDTIAALRSQLPAGTVILFITGADVIAEILSWKDTQRLLTMCEFVAVTRPGYSMSGIERVKEQLGSLASRVHVLRAAGLDISSSEIRERVRTGRPIKYLVPEAVEDYIKKMGFYTHS